MNANPSCDVTIFVKGAQNAQFPFRIFSQDFQDFESSYLWNGSRYFTNNKELSSWFLTVFHIKKLSKISMFNQTSLNKIHTTIHT